MKINISGKVVLPLFNKIKEFINPAIQIIKSHPGQFATGFVGAGLAADDIHQRRARGKQQKDTKAREQMTAEILKKHEAEIQTLKTEADKASNLEAINEQLCDALREKKGATESEKIHEDRTAD